MRSGFRWTVTQPVTAMTEVVSLPARRITSSQETEAERPADRA